MQVKTVAEIVAADMRTALVFKSHGIDFCCGGGKPVKDACIAKGVDYSLVMEELQNLDSELADSDYNSMSIDTLAEYILFNHHAYVKKAMPIISEFANKVAKVHGVAQPETVKIAEIFKEISEELSQHMYIEENVLFPYIIELGKAVRVGKSISAQFGNIKMPISKMEHEHQQVGDMFKELERLSDNFTPPDHACNTYKALYFHLKEFQDDLHIHIHLENNILFPKAIEMELEMLGEKI